MALRGAGDFEQLGDESVQLGETHMPKRIAWTVESAKGDPTARMEFELRGGDVFCKLVHIEATTAGRGITTGDLAGLPGLERLAMDGFLSFAVNIADAENGPPEWWLTNASPRDLARTNLRSHGQAQLKMAAQVESAAQIYRENVHGTPIEAVADALGLSYRTASRRVEKARDQGLLPRTSQGKRKA